MRAIILSLGVIIAATTAIPLATAQTADAPQIENARLEKKALAGALATEVKAWAAKAEQPQWLGYAVPQMGRERAMCCGDYDGSWRNGCGHCRLEDHSNSMNMTSKSEADATKLEAPRSIAVLFRAENKRLMKIRVVSMGCSLDAGGLPFAWLTGVTPSESIELLDTFVKGSDLEAHDRPRSRIVHAHRSARIAAKTNSILARCCERKGGTRCPRENGQERSQFGSTGASDVRSFREPRAARCRRDDPHGPR